jgi:hypothetical protein
MQAARRGGGPLLMAESRSGPDSGPKRPFFLNTNIMLDTSKVLVYEKMVKYWASKFNQHAMPRSGLLNRRLRG